MKVLVCGDRLWDNVDAVHRELMDFPPGTIVVHGACRGADFIAGEVAEQLGFTVRSYPADWNKFHRAAGPIRNRKMVELEHKPGEPIDLVIAFHSDIASSKGTRDMFSVAENAGLKTKLVTG